MNVLEQTVADFGRSLGLDNLRLKAQGAVVLSLQNIGILALEVAGPHRESILISLARPLPPGRTMAWTRCLISTHYRARLPVPMQAGFARDHLILAVVLAPEELDLPRLHETIRALDQQHNALEAAS